MQPRFKASSPRQGAVSRSERSEESTKCRPQARLQSRGFQFISPLQRAVASAGNGQLRAERAVDRGSRAWPRAEAPGATAGGSTSPQFPELQGREGPSWEERGKGRAGTRRVPPSSQVAGQGRPAWARPTEHPEEMGAAPTSRTFAVGNITARCGRFGGDRNVTSLGSALSTQSGGAPCVLPPLCSACRTDEGQSQLPFYEQFQAG